jgi:hypothetical protein
MDAHLIDQVSKRVFERFPGLRGSHPSVKPYAGDQFLLVYSGSASTQDGHTIQQTVRVVAGADGSIKKMTASR